MRDGEMITRLLKRGWKYSISTSSHELWQKKNWQCAIAHITGEARFSRIMKIDTVDLMRGEVEEGIE